MEHLLAWGLVDAFRRHHPEGGLYSWWDYRVLAFPKNDGRRLDFILATEPLATRCTAAEIDRGERKGDKPSDHAIGSAHRNGATPPALRRHLRGKASSIPSVQGIAWGTSLLAGGEAKRRRS
jgi:hypothetical protein